MEHYKQLAELREKNDFLGFEFLTWVFLQLIEKGELSHDENTKLILGNKVVTCLYSNREQKTSIICPLLEKSYEIFASIKNGHLIESISLQLVIDQLIINFNISAKDFSINQIKINNDFDKDNDLDETDQIREDIFLRMANLDAVENLINNIFLSFLKERLDSNMMPISTQNMKNIVEDFFKESLF